MKALIIIVVLLCAALPCFALVDSLDEAQTQQITDLQKSNEHLRMQLEAYADSSDKVYNAVYTSIAVIVAVILFILGFNTFNAYKSNVLEDKKVTEFMSQQSQNIKDEQSRTREELMGELSRDLRAEIKTMSIGDLSDLKKDLKTLLRKVVTVEEEILVAKIKRKKYLNSVNEYDSAFELLFELAEHIVRYGNQDGYLHQETLNSIVRYLKVEDNFVYENDIPMYINKLENLFENAKYRIDVQHARDLLIKRKTDL